MKKLIAKKAGDVLTQLARYKEMLQDDISILDTCIAEYARQQVEGGWTVSPDQERAVVRKDLLEGKVLKVDGAISTLLSDSVELVDVIQLERTLLDLEYSYSSEISDLGGVASYLRDSQEAPDHIERIEAEARELVEGKAVVSNFRMDLLKAKIY